MFDGGLASSPGVHYIDDINAQKRHNTGNPLIVLSVHLETAMKMPLSDVLDLI
jgi:hypothetical protein